MKKVLKKRKKGEKVEKYLLESFITSSIDKGKDSKENYQMKLLKNEEKKIITDIREMLRECDEFIISVAFITEGGITLILEELKELERKGIKGKILTGDYLNFTEPKALKKLMSYKNIELKLLKEKKLHAKGYFFRKNDIWNLIIGSSNLTQTALTTNLEWNLKVSASINGKISEDILNNFELNFKNALLLNDDLINEYEKIYLLSKQLDKKRLEFGEKNIEIIPNMMQEEALKGIRELRVTGKDRGLLISATGTGKTYLSAFDVKEFKPKRMLFIAHRKTILEKSKKSFEKIIKNKKMAIYTEENLLKNDYIFAMVQTLNKKEHLDKIPKDYFDYIIIDEVHHSGAKTYQNIINYFKPKFFLGMTATPERSDDFNIYELFDHNIAYEIRLHDALKEGLLCPFHYFGIQDITIDGKEIDEKTSIKNLVIDERVNNIIEKSRYYGYSGDKLHGLIFTSKIDEAEELSKKFNEKGIKAIALLGKSSDIEREKAIKSLENGEIEYLITVDIFNEGVDIPCINQVILLRPTESSIVYIQQLGRGLRKNENKDYVVILDFIGNYEKNFLIPVAISQNNNYDKDFMKRFLLTGTNIIPGESSIVFEEIVREKIYENINKVNFSTKKYIEHDFNLLEKQLGRTPFLLDFFKRNMIDPSVILKFRKDYDEILKLLRPKDNFPKLSELEKNYLEFISSVFTPAKRYEDIYILKECLERKSIDIESLQGNKEVLKNASMHLSKTIFTSLSTIKKYRPITNILENKINIEENFYKSYLNNSYFKKLIDDVIEYNLEYITKYYKNKDKSIHLYKEYSKQEAFKYLNLDFNNGYQVSGYTVFDKEKKVIIFITLDNTSPFTKYHNEFYDQQRFNWFSKSNRCLSRNGKITAEGKIANNEYTIEVFLKKKTGENFFYLGEVEKVLEAKEIIGIKGEPVVEYELKLKYEIEEQLFKYFNLKN